MNENLLVNSKTDILEFKRKHNLLVGNSSIKISATNITTLTDKELNNLRCGDMVQKKTENQFHNYIVSYKEENKGICLSYYACGYTETVSYDYTDGHWVYNSTDISLCNSLEEITDSHGHKRFAEDNGNVSPITGLSNTFCKWALSGTHLLLVCAGNLANETVIGNGTVLCEFVLPKWIFDKIYPVWGGAYIEYKEIDLRANNWIGQTLGVALYKGADNKVGFILPGGITLTDDRAFRVEFDLLIDNE